MSGSKTRFAQKVHLQSWISAEEFSVIQRACAARKWSVAQLVRESTKKYAEETPAA
jgi:hypothetical protein